MGMPDSNGRYGANELGSYEPEPCDVCGGPTRQDWINNRKMRDIQDWYIPGRRTCLTPERHRA